MNIVKLLILTLVVAFGQLALPLLAASDSTSRAGITFPARFDWSYVGTVKSDYYNWTNNSWIKGVDTRAGWQNPWSDNCYNPYNVYMKDGTLSILIPYTGTYTISWQLMFYQNQGGNVQVHSQLLRNGYPIQEVGTSMTYGNTGIYSTPVMTTIETLNKADTLQLKVYNGPCSQAYILTGGGISIQSQT